jgi:hypothetical protein
MLLAFAHPPSPRERSEQRSVGTLIKRRELKPFVQIFERIIVRDGFGKAFEQRYLTCSKSPPLCGEPAIERRAPGDSRAFQEIAVEQHRQRAQPVRCERVDALVGGTDNLESVDRAIRQVELNGVSLRRYTFAAGIVNNASDLA